MRLSYLLSHALVQWFDQVGYVAAPYRLRGSRNLEPLPLKDIFQPIQRQVIGELAGYDIGQQSRSGQALVDGRLRLGGYLDVRILPLLLAAGTGILLAHVVQTLKPARNIFDLPAFLGPDLLAWLAAAGAGALLRLQFMHVGSYRKIFEVGNLAASGPLLDPPQLVLGPGLRRKKIGRAHV